MFLLFNKRQDFSALDLLSVASAASYSLRKLRTAYAGQVIRVRRSSDNAELDIGFVGNLVDTATLLAFVGGENLLTQSQNFTNSSWTKGAGAISNTTLLAPDGTNTGSEYTEDNTFATHRFFNSVSITAGAVYTLSIYLKQGTRRYVSVAINNGNSVYVIVDTQTMTIVKATANGGAVYMNSSITAEANGWYRVSVTGSHQLSTVYPLINGVATSNGTPNEGYAGDGVSKIIMWGAQLNTGTLKAYQPTTTTALAGNGFITTWYDQSGNGYHQTQTTLAQQPAIVTGGVLETTVAGAKPTIRFGLVSTTQLTNSSIPYSNPFTMNAVATRTGTTSYGRILTGVNDTTPFLGAGPDGVQYATFTGNGTSWNDTNSNTPQYNLTNTPNVLTAIYGTGATGLLPFANGNAMNAKNGTSVPGNGISIGARTSQGFVGYISEVVIFSSSLSTQDRQALERNQGAYYGVNVA